MRVSWILLLIITTSLLGCSWLSDPGSSNSGSTSNANSAPNTRSAANMTAGREDPVADIDAMADRFLAQKAFRAKTTVFGDKDFTTVVEYVSPDRVHIKTGPGLERILIGNDLYITLDNKWEKIPNESGSPAEELRQAFKAERDKFFSGVSFVGEEMINAKPAFVYAYKSKGEGNIGENDSKIWVGKDDGLPVRIETAYRTGSIESVVIEYEYDPDIRIEAPKN